MGDTNSNIFVLIIAIFSIYSANHKTNLKENNEIDEENFCSIIYPSEKFKRMLDLYNDPECDPLEEGVVRFDSYIHTIVGFYIEPVQSSFIREKEILKISTVAYNRSIEMEEVVDIARLANTAISIRTFSNYIEDWQNDGVLHRVDNFETSVGNYGFRREQIQFMNAGFIKSFISVHDLRLILKNSDFLAISGAKVVVGEEDMINEFENLVFDRPEYFTFKFQGIRNIPEFASQYSNFRMNQTFIKHNKKRMPTHNPFEEYKDYIDVIDESEVVGKKSKFDEESIMFRTNAITRTVLKSSSSALSAMDFPEASFSSPCPPRWHNGQ